MNDNLNNNHTVYTYSNFREVKLMDIYILLDSKYAELELSKSAHISVYEKVLKELKEIENAISVLESHGVKFS
tara:strand:+ start:1892 stop:2110 length:219 start_codon:yes stop_codon:yes gene_type:complete